MKKICIYLDQFALTDLMESKNGESWFEIKELLIKGHKKGKLYCPLSSEHFIETSKKNYSGAKEHDLFFTKLSDGYCLKPELLITSQLISSKIRSNKITLRTYMYENVNNIFNEKDKYLAFNNVNDEFNGLINEGTKNLNSFRQLSNTQKIKSKVKKQMFNAIKIVQVNDFIDRLQNLQKNKSLKIRGDKIGNKEIPNWIDAVIERLLKIHRLKKKEIQKLIFELKNNGFDNIPTLDIRTSLEALSSIYSKNITPNDQIDFMRIINGLPISNILLTDKKRKSEILEIGLDKKYNVKIYSGVQTDLIELIKELKLYTQQLV